MQSALTSLNEGLCISWLTNAKEPFCFIGCLKNNWNKKQNKISCLSYALLLFKFHNIFYVYWVS